MISIVRLKKGALDHFRRTARNSKREIMAILIGHVTDKIVTVDRFVYPIEYDHQTPNSVGWRKAELDAVYRDAAEQGKQVVGDIHSHPGYDAVMSRTDWDSCENREVCGICAVYQKSHATTVRFWTKHSSLPCEVEFIK